MKIKILKSGTTLIEIIVYFTIVSFILLAAITFSIRISNIGLLSYNLSANNTSLDFITTIISENVHTADSISGSGNIFDNDTGALSLVMPAPAQSPTTFTLSGGNLMMQQGSATAVQLNPDNVQIDIFRIQRVQNNKTPDHLIFNITASPKGKDISQVDRDLSIHFALSLRKL